MARKAVTDGGKRDEIVAAATECFLEKGYDGTSVRSIMKKAGGEIGLFYYYFQSKDDVFDKVLDRFFSGYQRDFAQIADGVYRDPFRTLTKFFEYMKVETIRFRERYAANVHRTVRWAIRERTLTIIVPYIRQIIGVLAELGEKPPLDLSVTAMMLAYGAGSMIIHEDSDWMERSTKDAQKAVHLVMGIDIQWAELLFPLFPTQTDIPGIVSLADELKEYFPGFDRNGFEQQLSEKLNHKEILIIRYHGEIGGCIAFSRERKEIDFLAVRPECRKHGVATRLLITAMAEFPTETELSVVTYREGDSLGAEARRFYSKFGFREAELLTAFDYPCQRLTGISPENVLKAKTEARIDALQRPLTDCF